MSLIFAFLSFVQMRSCSWTAVPCVLLTSPLTSRGSLPSFQVTLLFFFFLSVYLLCFACMGDQFVFSSLPCQVEFYFIIHTNNKKYHLKKKIKKSRTTLTCTELLYTFPSIVIMWSNLPRENRANKVKLRWKVNIITVNFCYLDLPVFVWNHVYRIDSVTVRHSLSIISWLLWSLDALILPVFLCLQTILTEVLWFSFVDARKTIFKIRFFVLHAEQ